MIYQSLGVRSKKSLQHFLFQRPLTFFSNVGECKEFSVSSFSLIARVNSLFPIWTTEQNYSWTFQCIFSWTLGQNNENWNSLTLYHIYITGYEVSGTVHAIFNTVESAGYSIGDRVIIYPEDQHPMEDGYVLYMAEASYLTGCTF